MRMKTKDGLNIDYEVIGEGKPILCLPGLTRNASDFEPFIEGFEGKYKGQAQIITLTFRGREPSDFDPHWQNYNIIQEGKDAIELLDHLKIEKALWLGTSRGGLVSMAMSRLNKSRIAGVVLNDIGPEMGMEGLASIFEYLGIQPNYQSLDEAALALHARSGEDFPKLGVEDWRKLASRYYHFDEDGCHLRYDPKLRDALLEGVQEYDYWADFHSMKGLQLGLIWGMNSKLLTTNGVLKMHEARTDMRIAKIADAGHVPFLNEPASLKLIAQVLDESFADN